MSIDGVWGFVFAGQAGIGIGALVVKARKFHGTDSGGVKYKGTVTEDSATGELTLDFDMDIPAGVWLVGGSSPMDVAHTRHQSLKLPPLFGDLEPVELPVRAGSVTGIFKRYGDEYAGFAEGIEVRRRPRQ
jgi:hypothetical protein